MLEEFSKTVKAQLYERANSPLLGSFLIAWCIWNHRFIMVVLSELSFQEKIKYIDFHIFGGWQESLLNGLVYPLIAALFMLVIYPWPARFLYGYWRRQQNKIKADQQKIDGDVLLSIDESREIRKSEIRVKMEFDEQLIIKNQEIVALKEIIKELERKKIPDEVVSSTTNNLDDEKLTASQLKLLQSISDREIRFRDTTISQAKDKLLTQFDYGELLRRKLISENYSNHVMDYEATITHAGTSLLVKSRNHRNK